MTFNELQHEIELLTLAEKAQVLQWIVRDLQAVVPGIEKTVGIVGGSARVIRTRIPVWTLVQLRDAGMSEGEILTNYPTLKSEDLLNVWEYVRRFPEEIDTDIHENEIA